ncbi:FMN-binding glutamate synthase family protein [Exilibacterium tricleocarpae]|uniref:FMN-binding glutamate synthase family protein n=2 Tax=Exilibacterium tricleocarpae TaxID=2591008 RepID=A0A545STA3_9GAMM|nr:FMN-binding glutamate synthase family protein [Exilibacterium tricleocarpae]
MDALQEFALVFLEISALLLIFTLGVGLLVVLYMYLADITQTKQAIRRNYPVIGRFRYFFEHIGEFFRQYFFALDREELPFNRAQRSWVYRAAKNIDSTVAFGSTRPLNQPGDIIFLNCLFPTLTEDATAPRAVTIGERYARQPYTTESLFNISGMSFGALSVPAVQALSRGAKKAGIWMNTGEGALSPYHLEGGCDLVFQIGTAKYGVRDSEGRLCDERLRQVANHAQVKMFEIKMSQGAKPGKGGILPGGKVTPLIASTRGIPEGQDSISPNGHPEIRCLDDLLDMIVRIREVTGKPVGFKAVIGGYGWLDELFTLIHRRGLQDAPDFITIDSADGGTGAAPQSLIDFMGLPIKCSLPLVVDKLIEYNLRERIKVICSGKLINPSDVAWALCAGADFVTSARGFMFALGCIQALQCNKNTCPTGITTHDPDLQRGLDPTDKSERVYHFATNLSYEVGVIAHSCGVKEPRQLKRYHAQIINEHGIPEPMEELFPVPVPKPEYTVATEQPVARESRA